MQKYQHLLLSRYFPNITIAIEVKAKSKTKLKIKK